jgi:DNA-3-methyladenine glycosylase II
VKAKLEEHFVTKDPVLHAIVSLPIPYELETPPTGGSVFEALASSIASQQISGLVARKILERLMILHGNRFPTPAELATATPEALRAVGFSFAKVAALQDLAAHALDGRLPDDATLATLDDEAIIERCVAVRGIGRWTVQMLLMFHFGRQDVMPSDDYGVRQGFRLAYGLKGLPRPKALLAYAERWKPYRSAGAWYLWRAIELHQQGKLPKRVGRAPRMEIEAPKPLKAVRGKAKAGAKLRAKAKAKTKVGNQARAKVSKTPSKARRKVSRPAPDRKKSPRR